MCRIIRSVTTANKSSENEKLKEYYQMKIRKIKKRDSMEEIIIEILLKKNKEKKRVYEKNLYENLFDNKMENWKYMLEVTIRNQIKMSFK